MGENARQRKGNIEALRILAMLLIITGHMLGDNGGNLLGQAELYSFRWYLLWAIESVCVLGTNCFILISGYFIIDSKFSWKKCLKFGFQIWMGVDNLFQGIHHTVSVYSFEAIDKRKVILRGIRILLPFQIKSSLVLHQRV